MIIGTRKIEELFKNSISVKEDCIQKGFLSIVIMGDQITHSIENNGKIIIYHIQA